ncbi:hypothetical protein EDB81DRAFT_400994 [Dactylonectria macrodidyma]|uniref:FAD-binding FR-type domain-containing protein n=1 Tax=Dactylonectria macrodidyma TaxID=307937 RepID=A0A9P9F8S6_9HYPO|nr:hypothetical protein EDB81DRAFT_400994 [Dactylonectria macrodidyma]
MLWPYEFVTLSDEEKVLRRASIGAYASLAFWSAFSPVAALLVVRLAARVRRLRNGAGRYREVPGSPAVKAGTGSWAAVVERRWRTLRWWMGEDVYFVGAHWGHRDEWVLGLAWTVWLLSLCVRDTGKDYLHLTKRFGAIATSQLPVQYLLSLKYLSPFGYFFRSSHERLNRYHRVLGRIIYFLLILHAIFYNVFFVASGIWLQRFFAYIVFAGVVAFTLLHTLNGTSMAAAREQSYRVFFVVHLTAAVLVPPLIFFHAPSARIYVSLALGFLVLDLAARKITAVTAPATVETIPGTDLIRISASMPSKNILKFKAHPGAHLYLSLPPVSRPDRDPLSTGNLLFEFLYNPFTVVSADDKSNDLTFVARKRSGPMTTRLAQFAAAGAPSTPEGRIPLCIEGPYGAAGKAFPDLVDSGVGQILLVAGGVGAAFAVPVYHAIVADSPSARVQLVWAVRSPGDATWAPSDPTGKSLMTDDQVHLFLTGDMGVSNTSDTANGDIQLASRPSHNAKRPNFQKIVDDLFKAGTNEKVAVLVCGPAQMGRELRQCITPWVMKGRDVWWHDESFGW